MIKPTDINMDDIFLYILISRNFNPYNIVMEITKKFETIDDFHKYNAKYADELITRIENAENE